jgi:hypothetical protein
VTTTQPVLIDDRELVGLCLDRQRLLRQLAPVLRRVGPSRPPAERRKLNIQRSKQRKLLRAALRANAEAISARCMQLADLLP